METGLGGEVRPTPVFPVLPGVNGRCPGAAHQHVLPLSVHLQCAFACGGAVSCVLLYFKIIKQPLAYTG